MPSTTGPILSEDDIDDLLYSARAGDLEDLRTTLTQLAKTTNAPQLEILTAAVDSSSGNGVLHMASANGHTEIIHHLLSLLANSQSLLNLQNAAGNTSLHWACLNGHLPIIKALLAARADPTTKNKAGHDAVYEAEIAGKEEVVRWLLEEGKGLEAGVDEGKDGGRENMGQDSSEGGDDMVEGKEEVGDIQRGFEEMKVGGKEGEGENGKIECGVRSKGADEEEKG